MQRDEELLAVGKTAASRGDEGICVWVRVRVMLSEASVEMAHGAERDGLAGQGRSGGRACHGMGIVLATNDSTA